MKIGLCTLTIGEAYKERTKWTTINKKSYCKRHGYDFIDDETIWVKSKPIPWSKILLLLKYIEKYDYIVWIDADILIMNMDIKIESLIQKYPQYDQITGSDWKMQNTGVWIIKNTMFSKLFLTEVWDNVYDEKSDPHERYMNWEQGSVINLMDRNFMDCKNKIKVTYPEEMNSYWFNYFPGHFVLHFAGVRDELDSLIREYYPERLDTDSDESYESRMVYLAGPVREYLDRKLQHDKFNERMGVIHSWDEDVKKMAICSVDYYTNVLQNNKRHFDALFDIVKRYTNHDASAFEGNYFYNHQTFDLAVDRNKQINLFSIASMETTQSVLEIGFNAGHSTLLFLLANPTSKIYCFDTCQHNYTKPCFEYLSQAFPGRLELIEGRSGEQMEKYKASHSQLMCDVIHIDGDHELSNANGDFFRSLGYAKYKAFLIYNNVDMDWLRMLWDGYIRDLHLKDITSHFYPTPSQAIGMYCKF
jgi:predicted O-methyltransferase YrrM